MMSKLDTIEVELAPFVTGQSVSGIGRYTLEIYKHLQNHICVSIKPFRFLPFANRFTTLKSFPLGILDHNPGSIIHFPQIMGGALMLWHPVHPSITTVHDLGILVTLEDRKLFNLLDRCLLALQYQGLKFLDHIVVHSDHTKQGLLKILGIPPNRITIIPSSVDLHQFSTIPNSRKILSERYGINFDNEIAYMIYVGSELPRKNLDLLLEAMSILKAQSKLVKFIKLGGPGGAKWRKNFLNRISQLGLEDQIILAGYVPESDLPLFYNAADFAITSTLLEGGFAWVAMEAMACGKPAVASKAALIPEHAQAAAIIVPSYTPNDFAQAICRIAEDKALREEMGQTGQKIIQVHTWENEIIELLKVYEIVQERQK